MECFGCIEDDYIEVNNKSDPEEHRNYEAFHCEPCWFLTPNESIQSSQPIVIKFKADYMFMKRNYKEAAECYNIYLTQSHNLNLSIKRECLEGLSRSYLNQQCYCYSLKYAYLLYELGSTFDSYSVSITLLSDCTYKARRYDEALLYGMKLVTLHPFNSDMWLKLACTFAVLQEIPLYISTAMQMTIPAPHINDITACCAYEHYSLPCDCENPPRKSDLSSKILGKEMSVIALCLLYAEFHLKSVSNSALGFALTHNLDFLEKISKDLYNLDIDSESILLLKQRIQQKVLHLKNEKETVGLSNENTDAGSVKLCSNEEIQTALKHFKVDDFMDKWLSFDCQSRMTMQTGPTKDDKV